MTDRIDVQDGKYTVVIGDTGVTLLRYGQPWGEPPGQVTYGNMIIAMAYELQDLRTKVPQQTTTTGHDRCPFCGSTVDPKGWLAGDGTKGPECTGCGATAPDMETWNKRTTSSWGPIMAHHKDGKYRLAWIPLLTGTGEGDPVVVRWAGVCGWRDAHGDEWQPTHITDAPIVGPNNTNESKDNEHR